MSIIRTKEELKAAVERGDSELVIEGELASKLHKTRTLARLAPAAVAIVIAATVTAPYTFGMSLAAAASITGAEIAIIILAVAMGIGLVFAIWKGYDEMEFNLGPPPRLILRKKQQ